MSNWIKAAEDWAERAVARGSTFEQIDIDGLLDQQPPDAAVQLAIQCARAVRAVLDATRPSLEVAVAIPLPAPEDEQIPTAVPALGDVLDAAWLYGPGLEVPGLYLLEPQRWVREDEGEEYRRVLKDPRAPDGFELVYSAWRSKADERRAWPFNRCLWLRCRSH